MILSYCASPCIFLFKIFTGQCLVLLQPSFPDSVIAFFKRLWNSSVYPRLIKIDWLIDWYHPNKVYNRQKPLYNVDNVKLSDEQWNYKDIKNRWRQAAALSTPLTTAKQPDKTFPCYKSTNATSLLYQFTSNVKCFIDTSFAQCNKKLSVIYSVECFSYSLYVCPRKQHASCFLYFESNQ